MPAKGTVSALVSLAPGFRIDLPQGLALGGAAVLAPCTLEVPAGRVTALLGPSGSGKSTLVRLAAGLLALPPGGSVRADDGGPLAGRIAWMAQQDLLVPWRDALGNVTLGAHLRGERPDPARARRLLAEVGLAEADAAKPPAALSGGMRQRVALARTLMEDRPVVLMDEPFSAVDAPTRHRLQDLSARLLAGRTVLLVTHDPWRRCGSPTASWCWPAARPRRWSCRCPTAPHPARRATRRCWPRRARCSNASRRPHDPRAGRRRGSGAAVAGFRRG
jgi:putative hydroxymethylpyrimidine transport system ATP-binding protein